jgi:putative DNA primase/helicase
VPTNEDGGKRPFGAWKSYQAERLPWDQLERLLASRQFTGIGVLTGATSGNVEMIEIEGPLDLALKRLAKVAAKAREYAQIGMDDLLQRLAKGCAEQSAGGGLHLFYFVTDGPALGNTKLAHADGKVIAETRGEGGFVVVAPTTGRNGHAEGSAYHCSTPAPLPRPCA